MSREEFMRRAIAISEKSVKSGGGPFGAVVVKNGKIIAEASNSVTIENDPTSHAEVNAIRAACRVVKDFKLEGCELYTSCEPCPMCLGAAYWAGIEKIYYGNTKGDAADVGFDDSFIYQELERPLSERKVPAINMLRTEALVGFKMWSDKEDKVEY